MEQVIMVYITAQDKTDASNIAKELVEDGFAACTNVIQGVSSVYKWQGAVEEAKETVIIAKTVESKLDALIEKVKSLHSSSCPCVVSLPVSGGNEDYLKWVKTTLA